MTAQQVTIFSGCLSSDAGKCYPVLSASPMNVVLSDNFSFQLPQTGMVKCYHKIELLDNLLRVSNATFVLKQVDFKFAQQMSCLQVAKNTPVLSLYSQRDDSHHHGSSCETDNQQKVTSCMNNILHHTSATGDKLLRPSSIHVGGAPPIKLDFCAETGSCAPSNNKYINCQMLVWFKWIKSIASA